MIFKKLLSAILCAALITGCATQSQNQYSAADIGQQINVDFGVVIAMREVKVQRENTGVGATGGMVAGGVAGSAFGQGEGQGYAILGGMLVGAIAGAAAEYKLKNQIGIEYTITKTDGHTIMVVQNIAKDDKPIQVGQRVMIQTSGETKVKGDGKTITQENGGYVRVLPADNLPTEIMKPQGIKFTRE